jgi:DNA-binding NarL/FixJ family response regulator
MIRVLLVDDDPLVRSDLRIMPAAATSVEVVAEAADGREVLAAQPDPPAVLVLTTFDADEL